MNKTYGLPAVMSFLVPGLGQMLKGQVGKGILFFIGFFISFLFPMGFLIVWFWNVYDAYNSPVLK